MGGSMGVVIDKRARRGRDFVNSSQENDRSLSNTSGKDMS